MPDLRFFQDLGPVSLQVLADLTGAVLSDPSRAGQPMRSAAPLNRAGGDSVSFLSDRRYVADLASTASGACFLTAADAGLAPEGCVALITPTPQAAFAVAAGSLYQPLRHGAGASIHPTATFEAGVDLAPGVVVGPGASIGAGTVIGANASIGPGVAIGRNCQIGANVSIGFALIGDGVRILAGARIGEAGFGVAGSATGAIDVPQLGRVIIQDGVTLGAGTCVDRGAFEDTTIGENTKIDNMVQIAHNVVIGRNCVIAAQTGLSGSVTVGDGVAFGGQAGIADHITIGSRARIAGSAGVMKNVPDGETWGGFPARPIRRWLRETAVLAQLAAGREKGNRP